MASLLFVYRNLLPTDKNVSVANYIKAPSAMQTREDKEIWVLQVKNLITTFEEMYENRNVHQTKPEEQKQVDQFGNNVITGIPR